MTAARSGATGKVTDTADGRLETCPYGCDKNGALRLQTACP
ncbi:MAG: hypothetical protein OXT65_04080 [Alphaproteobacteria bacterium]|nr:hypothetical protein [Alphaproteobacteria bacterium]MDD9900135.1 hypothetical protein [Alphaproteobacteria bacterium]